MDEKLYQLGMAIVRANVLKASGQPDQFRDSCLELAESIGDTMLGILQEVREDNLDPSIIHRCLDLLSDIKLDPDSYLAIERICPKMAISSMLLMAICWREGSTPELIDKAYQLIFAAKSIRKPGSSN